MVENSGGAGIGIKGCQQLKMREAVVIMRSFSGISWVKTGVHLANTLVLIFFL